MRPELEKIPDDASIQKNLRIPGYLWNRIIEVMKQEGYPTFSALALPAITSKVRQIEQEVVKKQTP